MAESLDGLDVRAGAVIVDATYGAGGHTRALVERGARVIAFDLDPDARLPEEDLAASVTLVRRNFAELALALEELGRTDVDGVLFDLGVSSMQFDRAERGFSLLRDGPLDMRMNSGDGPTAYDLLARSSEGELADIIFNYGDERAARRIARAVVAARENGRLPERTLELARMVAGVVHVRGKRERIHPATRTFQALRIAVNDELGSLERGLDAAIAKTRPGGRIAVISFHSLEDRIVKLRFRESPQLRVVTKKPLLPAQSAIAQRQAPRRGAPSVTASPLERPYPFDDAPERPRTGTRAGRGAVSRRRARTRQLRNAGFKRLFSTVFVVTLAVVVYLGLMANVTRMNYGLAKAAREKAQLVDATSRLDDRIARLESRERLGAVAGRLGMRESQSFIAVNVPPEHRAEAPHGLAFLTWLK